jgi:hypothetical protein
VVVDRGRSRSRSRSRSMRLALVQELESLPA